MYKDSIITLDNGLEYLVVSEYDVEDRKYIMAAMIDSEKDLIDEDFMVKAIVQENGKDKIITIEDPDELAAATQVLLTEPDFAAGIEDNKEYSEESR